jgi:hypothetical protein
MAREIRTGDRIVGLGVVLAAAHVDADGVIWDTGIRESHEDIGRNAEHWRHESGEEISAGRPFIDDSGVVMVEDCWAHIGYAGRPAPLTPCTDAMAIAIFRTDHDVLAFCSRVGERHTVERSGGDTTFRNNDAAFRRALDIAWERDESGWRTRAIARAEAVIAEMCR